MASGSLAAFAAPGMVEWVARGDEAVPHDTHAAALAEMRSTLGGALRLLMQQSGLEPEDIDIVFTTSTMFSPCPSLSSMLVNEFKLRPDVTTLSVSGMGCSFGVVGVGAVRDLMLGRLAQLKRERGGGPLQRLMRLFSPSSSSKKKTSQKDGGNSSRSKNKKNPSGAGVVNAVFLTGECTTKGIYLGKDRAMLTSTALMRQGAAAAWLSTSARPKGGRGARGTGGRSRRGGEVQASALLEGAPRRRRRRVQEHGH